MNNEMQYSVFVFTTIYQYIIVVWVYGLLWRTVYADLIVNIVRNCIVLVMVCAGNTSGIYPSEALKKEWVGICWVDVKIAKKFDFRKPLISVLKKPYR